MDHFDSDKNYKAELLRELRGLRRALLWVAALLLVLCLFAAPFFFSMFMGYQF